MPDLPAPTIEDLRKLLDRAQKALVAAGGTLPVPAEGKDSPLTCDQLLGAAAVSAWYAATAAIEGAGEVYVGYYSGLSNAYAAQADAMDC